MKKFKEYDEIQKLKIKKIISKNFKTINFKIGENDYVLFENLNLIKLIKNEKEYLFNNNIIINI